MKVQAQRQAPWPLPPTDQAGSPARAAPPPEAPALRGPPPTSGNASNASHATAAMPQREPDPKFKSDTEGPSNRKEQRLGKLAGSTASTLRPSPAPAGGDPEEFVRAPNGERVLAPEMGGPVAYKPGPMTLGTPLPTPAPREGFWHIVGDTLQHPAERVYQSYAHIGAWIFEGREASAEELNVAKKIGGGVDIAGKLLSPELNVASAVGAGVEGVDQYVKTGQIDTQKLIDGATSLRPSLKDAATAKVPHASKRFNAPMRTGDGRVGYRLSPIGSPRLPGEPSSGRSSAPPPSEPTGAPPASTKAPAENPAGTRRPGSPSAEPPAKRPLQTQPSPAATPAPSTSQAETSQSAQAQPPAARSGPSGAEVGHASEPRPSTSQPPADTLGARPPAAGIAQRPEEPAGPPPEVPRTMEALVSPEHWKSRAERYMGSTGDFKRSHQQAFDKLSAEETYTVRNWSFVDGQQGHYIDRVGGQDVLDSRQYTGMNFQLNEYLREPGFNPQMERNADILHIALSKLPRPAETVPLLRVADVEPGYSNLIKPGDYVTNGRSFMSAASTNKYTVDSLKEGTASGRPTRAMAVYKIESDTATPLSDGISTLAGHEAEWIFTPNRVFKVNETFDYWKTNALNQAFPVTAVRLEEVPVSQPIAVKNIQTGEPLSIQPYSHEVPPHPDQSSEGSVQWDTPPSSGSESG